MVIKVDCLIKLWIKISLGLGIVNWLHQITRAQMSWVKLILCIVSTILSRSKPQKLGSKTWSFWNWHDVSHYLSTFIASTISIGLTKMISFLREGMPFKKYPVFLLVHSSIIKKLFIELYIHEITYCNVVLVLSCFDQ